MKRIKAACLQQTIHFQLKEGLERDEAVRGVQEEYQRYKAQLDRNRTTYRILSESPQSDGSLIIEIKKQYNTRPVGDYLN